MVVQATVEREWVGLRPGRACVRLEVEDLSVGGPQGCQQLLKVVHNYGHGGGGITLHWGCAAHAVRLVKQSLLQLREQPLHSKL